jgi:hypothetical protein
MGKGAGKKKAGLVEGVTDAAIDIGLVGDKTRCGTVQNSIWTSFMGIFIVAAILCFVFPQETYSQETCDDIFHTGPHFRALESRFFMSHESKEIEVCSYDSACKKVADPCPKATVTGLISFVWVVMMFSTLSALPYFITFTFFPGWAYKMHFRGGGKMCGLPLTCGKVASANDEQTHQADQMSRLLGIFIGLTFGIINLFTRMGLENQGDGLIAHSAVWFFCTVFHISSLWNKGSPRCYALYQMIFSAALGGLAFLCTKALDDLLGFSLVDEMASTF